MSDELSSGVIVLTYCAGIVQNHTQALLAKKKLLKDLIKQRLRE